MTYELIIEIAFKSFVTSGLALLVLAFCNERSAAERSLIAHVGLLATLLLPLAAIFLPKLYLPQLYPHSPEPVEIAPVAGPASASAAMPAAPGEPASAMEPLMAVDLGSMAFWFYALVAAGLMLVTLLAVVRLFMLRASAAVLVEPKWLSALAHAQRRMGFKHGTALLISDALASPVSWGVLRPIILLNEDAVNSQAEAEAIIAHELAHVAHLDWAKLLVARAATALFWFNPLVWLLARQCHQLREEAADDAVLLSDVPSTDYAALLIGAARHDNKGTLLAANGVAPGRGSLKRRVTRVLDSKLKRAPARIGWGAACAMGGLLVAGPLSALTVATPPPSPSYAAAADPARPAPLAVVAEAAASSARLAIAAATDAEAEAVVEAAPVAAALEAAVAPSIQVPPAPAPAAAAAAAAKATAPLDAVISGTVATALAEVSEKLGPEFLAQMRRLETEKSRRAAAAGTRHSLPTPEQLVTLRIHGVSADYARQMAEAGYRDLPPQQLASASIHRVTPEYVREIAEAGYSGLSLDQLIQLRIHGVTASFIRGLAEAGYNKLSHKDIVSAAIHRVTPEFVRELAAAGYTGLTMKQLTSMRIHGVSPAYIREMRSIGYDKLPPDRLIDLRIQGAGGRERIRVGKIWPGDLQHRVIIEPGPPPQAPPAPPAQPTIQ
jgi:beta-lactamase regulating signal transducer with metallopeptidase domain